MLRNIIVSWIGTFLQLFLRFSWGVISLPIALLFHLNSIQIGLVATVFYIGYVVSSIPWGLVIDRIGPSSAVEYASILLVGMNLLLFLFLTSYAILLVAYLIEGLITAAIFPSAMKIVAVSYSNSSKFTFYVALVESAGPITIITLGIIASFLLHLWRFIYLIMAISFGLIAIFSHFNRIDVNRTEIKRSFKIILDRKITIATIVRLGELWSTWGTTTWIFPMLVLYRNISPTLSGIFLLLFGVGQLVGILSVERLVERFGDRTVILINLIGFILLTFSIIFSNNIDILPEAFLLGIFSFSYRPPTDSLIVRIAGQSSAGTSIGYANAVSQIGTMIAPSFVGLTLYLTHSFSISMLALDVGCIISIISLLSLKHL
ncbi:MFS transporter [Saccharolobus islandicus]|uniref:Major facilitator superfamily MFS_1 n=1 Tax=Saccharolobus islandicus (strain REY15A) TaxID=930945 RepID=F0NH66_SACI5|nr:MFS transporter [Sulfolobus islandicus]ADX84865.1 major facilitator superfamily MFS_1 [Sulfolobus islandicus REY15A]